MPVMKENDSYVFQYQYEKPFVQNVFQIVYPLITSFGRF